MQRKILAILIASLTGCATQPPGTATFDLINDEMSKAAKVAPAQPDAVAAALLPPMQIEVPKPRQPLEERFSLAFNNVPAAQFFMSLVSGTPYNMLVHPEVSGTISANLKDVTLFEALDAIRELYGYDYTVDGRRIVIKPLTLQTKVFHVNYLTGARRGSSDTRVSSGSVGDVQPSSTTSNATNTSTSAGGGTARTVESAKVSTALVSDFWGELRASLEAIVGGSTEGRSVVVSPQAGVVVVRAMPDELRNVASYLKATQLSVDRQVILEAKILEVQLNDSYQTGVNWAAFRTHGNSRGSLGLISPGAGLTTLGAGGTPNAITSAGSTAIGAVPGTSLVAPVAAAGSMFGLAFQTSNFAALISFLETQGTVHVLSSPRIATLNNQKAVLKVGTDEFFVTNVSATTTTGTSTTTTPSVTLQPFFSGVVLDVTPQIDDRGNIILHVHPSVSQVSTVNKSIDLGSLGGSLNLPLASSNTSETDSVVRGQDGQIVAIGGLMRQATVSDRSQIPGAGNVPGVGNLFRNTSQTVQKRELVILLKPTIVQGGGNWSQDILESQQRMQRLDPRAAPMQ
ncbi:pilus (MSHA type) biogenesis protein MshL [Noviherbaspirillum aridicola]|uniref:Pilus (MSHA type) biogenesis protein MshL n=1 Tax=Noviherbaspirillum aridicola TaxID=2849687 RepID=A0ABQ4Q5G3_9BURK|nr:pilus (MSHA type) biogenesis protein MshL [Noviherbaspirillum aridicola]GIZ52437.1 pilus (MSHA type) biogenesis protein MshL [Noviherbaspirillum aridicola]